MEKHTRTASSENQHLSGKFTGRKYFPEFYYPFKPFIVESSQQRCSTKKVFLEVSQNSQENPCASASFLIKLQA